MPENNDKKDEDELVKKLIREIKNDNSEITEEEVERLKDVIYSLMDPKYSKLELFFIRLKHFLRVFLLEYVLCSLLFCLMLSKIVIEPKWIIFIISFVLSILFIIIRKFNSGRNYSVRKYLISMGLVTLNFCLLNNYFQLFESYYCWILFIIGEMISYFSISLLIAHVYLKKEE